MPRMIFVNLPVQDLSRTKPFFEALGFSFNPMFSDENAACLVIDENIFAMLLHEERFKDFIVGEIAPRDTTEALLALSCESREEVDSMLEKALANGGSEWKPVHEEGPMYGGSFRDPEGHVWEAVYTDMSKVG